MKLWEMFVSLAAVSSAGFQSCARVLVAFVLMGTRMLDGLGGTNLSWILTMAEHGSHPFQFQDRCFP